MGCNELERPGAGTVLERYGPVMWTGYPKAPPKPPTSPLNLSNSWGWTWSVRTTEDEGRIDPELVKAQRSEIRGKYSSTTVICLMEESIDGTKKTWRARIPSLKCYLDTFFRRLCEETSNLFFFIVNSFGLQTAFKTVHSSSYLMTTWPIHLGECVVVIISH